VFFCLALLGDGKTLASGSKDKTVRLWNTEIGKEVFALEGHMSSVNCLTLLGDSKTLASGSTDRTVRLWDTQSSECLKVMTGHTGSVFCLALLGDSKTLASGSWDGTVRLWDIAKKRCNQVLMGHGNWDVVSLTILPDGRLVSGSRDITMRIWNENNGLPPQREAMRGLLERVRAEKGKKMARVYQAVADCLEEVRVLAYLVMDYLGTFGGVSNTAADEMIHLGESLLEAEGSQSFAPNIAQPPMIRPEIEEEAPVNNEEEKVYADVSSLTGNS